MKQTIKYLTDLLNRANDAYYKQNKPIMSDAEFDTAMYQLEKLEREFPQFKQPDSPTTHVGSDTTTHDGLVHHEVPMLSLANTYNAEELTEAIRKFNTDSVVVEWKVDGCSLSILYEGGMIRQLSTRGDGNDGQNVTHHLEDIEGIPTSIPFKGRVEIRGEVYMSYEQFDKYNQCHPNNTLANPRNGCAGLLAKKTRCGKWLSFIAYYADGIAVTNQEDALNSLDWGQCHFETPNIIAVKATDNPHLDTQIKGIIELEMDIRKTLSFPTDGLVIKVNDFAERNRLGAGSKYPNWAIAYKFEAENQGSTLRNVVWQVGSTGKLTPVAEFDPIPLAGTMVQRATLNNWDWLHELTEGRALYIGDTVYVEKGGEIIPKVTRIESNSTLHERVFQPTTCPECGAPVVKCGANHFCTNEECPARVKGAILHWCDKDCMDIKGIGPSVVEQAIGEGGFHDIVSMYKWASDQAQYVGFGGFLSKSTENLVNAIIDSCTQPAWRVLHALHIPGIGKSMSKELIKQFGSIERLSKATYAELSAVPGLGSVNTQSIVDWFSKPSNIVMLMMLGKYLQALQETSREAEGTVAATAIEENLANGNSNLPSIQGGVGGGSLSFLVSGNFGTPSRRRELEQLADQYGHLASSVSSGLDYLVIPNDGIDAWKQKAGSKYTKMQKWGHLDRIITEDEFLKLING